MIWRVLGFVFSWVAPFVVIYLNHIVLTPTTYEVDMFGLLIVLIMLVSFVKWIDNKVKIWKIQDKHKVFILNWEQGKKILLMFTLTWILFTIDKSLPKMQWSALIISFCFVIGYLFTLLGTRKKNKEVYPLG